MSENTTQTVNITSSTHNSKDISPNNTEIETKQKKGMNHIHAFQQDCYKTLRLNNGIKLQLSSLDAKFLGFWLCYEKKHRHCYCSKMKPYGDGICISEFYMKPKSRSIIF